MSSQFYRALVLDDEYFLGQIIVKALSKEDIESIAVTDVDSAINKLDQQSFDIVISDIYLPQKNGLDFFNYARNHHPDLPFIFITGNPNLETAIDSLKKGAYDYLSKPFMIPDLVNKVKEVIHESRKRRQERIWVNDLRQILKRRMEEFQIYQDIFENKKEGLLIVDLEGIIVKVNPGFERMSGIQETGLLNKPLSVLQKQMFPEINFQEIHRMISEKGQWKKEFNAKRMNNEDWIANISFSPIQDEKGNSFAYSAIINDVTNLRQVEKALINSLENTTKAQEAIIFGLACLAEYRDKETGFHLERIRCYTKELAMALSHHAKYEDKVNEKFIDLLYRTAPLHDIGKVGIPDHILLKKGKLTREEYERMKEHAYIGYQTLDSIRQQYGEMDFLNMGIEITYCHHERYDGKGYPRGLKEDEIPLPAQILAIADVYDALTSKRVYKKAFSHEVSVNTMKLERGKHFDPDLFDVFLSIVDKFNEIRQDFFSKEQAIKKASPEKALLLS